MIIGIKYCGGCNSVYERGRQVNLLKERFPEHEFRSTADGNICDVWLIVCGCLRACASVEGLVARRRMFILSTERSLVEVQKYLIDERAMTDAPPKKKLYIGQRAEMKKSFHKEDVHRFADLTGDHSKLHMDAEFAKASIYGRPVVHGVLAASLISSVMGMHLPGEGTVLVEEQVRFVKPVFYGDTVHASVEFASCREGSRQYIGTFSGVCTNQHGEVVVVARCRQLMTKDLFEVENPDVRADSMKTEEYWR